jgi:hypothetical protein
MLELGEPVKQINKKRSKKWASRIEAHEVKSAGRKPIKGGSRYGVVPTCVMLLCAVISSWVQLTHKIKDKCTKRLGQDTHRISTRLQLGACPVEEVNPSASEHVITHARTYVHAPPQRPVKSTW